MARWSALFLSTFSRSLCSRVIELYKRVSECDDHRRMKERINVTQLMHRKANDNSCNQEEFSNNFNYLTKSGQDRHGRVEVADTEAGDGDIHVILHSEVSSAPQLRG